ncbi:hypothetical protein M9X92_001157 [Pyricularia oryzae]|nr:hypothetical protein M9X92_001157 [Pyricularia oryzae]
MSLEKIIYGWNPPGGFANKTSRGCLLLHRCTHPPVRYRHLCLAVPRIERVSARSGKVPSGACCKFAIRARRGGGGVGFHLRSTSSPTLKACSGIQFQAHDPGNIFRGAQGILLCEAHLGNVLVVRYHVRSTS